MIGLFLLIIRYLHTSFSHAFPCSSANHNSSLVFHCSYKYLFVLHYLNLIELIFCLGGIIFFLIIP
uniref:Uncharacterized protein n=1 Tax=Manihot esculenta TaxID=3983 RepID=A0A2C9UNW7_MANES